MMMMMMMMMMMIKNVSEEILEILKSLMHLKPMLS